MIIQIQLCDHCDSVIHGPAESYRIGDGPTLDICSSCQQKPFRRVAPSARGKAVAETMRLALSAR